MAELEAQNHTATQQAHQDDMKALRATLDDDKRGSMVGLRDQLQKQEVQHTERMAQVVAKYEKQIQTLKDQLEHERRGNDTNLKRSVEEMQRTHKTSIDQLESQNRDRLHQLNVQHNEEIKEINKRNDEKLNQVLAEVKKA